MAGYIGKIEPFDKVAEEWSSYEERLQEYLTANDIANDKKVSVLITLLRRKHTLD